MAADDESETPEVSAGMILDTTSNIDTNALSIISVPTPHETF
jgi:hypothetical protein